jgi:phosphoribosylanthranilate isomerase
VLWPAYLEFTVPEIKFCGLTRPEDAQFAAALGASYVGVIFAGGLRELTPSRAREVLSEVPASVKRVGVFADQSVDDIAAVARDVGLSVVQLHGACDVDRIRSLRALFDGEVWAVVRVQQSLPASTASVLAAADGLLLDAYRAGALGGTGATLPWSDVSRELQPMRAGRVIVLAGGLRPENVAQAIAAMSPDVVDVSSGVESAPGIKDHERMRAFRDAVMHASINT